MSIITPPPYGRPDYSAPLDLVFGAPFVNKTNESINPNGEITYGPFDVSQYAYIAGNVTNDRNPQNLSFQWYADKAETVAIGLPYTYIMGGLVSAETNFHIPNSGPWLTITSSNPSAISTVVYDIVMFGSNADGVSPFYDGLLSNYATAINATEVGPMFFTSNGGFVTVTYYSEDQVGTVTLQLANDQGGVGQTIWQDANFTDATYHTVNMILPYGSILANITTGAAFTSAYLSLANNVSWG